MPRFAGPEALRLARELGRRRVLEFVSCLTQKNHLDIAIEALADVADDACLTHGEARFIHTERTTAALGLGIRLCRENRRFEGLRILESLNKDCIEYDRAAEVLAALLQCGDEKLAVEFVAALSPWKADTALERLLESGTEISPTLRRVISDPMLRMRALHEIDLEDTTIQFSTLEDATFFRSGEHRDIVQLQALCLLARAQRANGRPQWRETWQDAAERARRSDLEQALPVFANGAAALGEIADARALLLDRTGPAAVEARLALDDVEAAVRLATDRQMQGLVSRWLLTRGRCAEALALGHSAIEVAQRAHALGDSATAREAILNALDEVPQTSVVRFGPTLDDEDDPRNPFMFDERDELIPLAADIDPSLVTQILARLTGEALQRGLLRSRRFDQAHEPFPSDLVRELVDPDRGQQDRRCLATAMWPTPKVTDTAQILDFAEGMLKSFRKHDSGVTVKSRAVIICLDQDRRQSKQQDECLQRASLGEWEVALSIATGIPAGRFREDALDELLDNAIRRRNFTQAERAANLLDNREAAIRGLCSIARAASDQQTSHHCFEMALLESTMLSNPLVGECAVVLAMAESSAVETDALLPCVLRKADQDPHPDCRALCELARALAARSDIDTAARLLDRAVDEAASFSSLNRATEVLTHVICTLADLGRFDRALEVAEQLCPSDGACVQELPAGDLPLTADSRTFAISYVAQRLAENGQTTRAWEILVGVEAIAADSVRGWVVGHLTRGRHWDQAIKLVRQMNPVWRSTRVAELAVLAIEAGEDEVAVEAAREFSRGSEADFGTILLAALKTGRFTTLRGLAALAAGDAARTAVALEVLARAKVDKEDQRGVSAEQA